jgi:hypothetical protein
LEKTTVDPIETPHPAAIRMMAAKFRKALIAGLFMAG